MEPPPWRDSPRRRHRASTPGRRTKEPAGHPEQTSSGKLPVRAGARFEKAGDMRTWLIRMNGAPFFEITGPSYVDPVQVAREVLLHGSPANAQVTVRWGRS